ncbi:acyltransferase family protein [Chitinophaga pinensis]|uniref:Acyltransferase 3 n=1 Tax=Chitinophaga pinensis (strain ATCC 43595 / DSM 2588 / LMG 13176 / NBRC 15968 / NCIMB 11800 / UQM 2034) TaxID=485918 RepID=A0A979G3A2_CHIPD|nr:acyltransferase [Chitinophaga pinensis]ACU59985.1 acyltransferase 3 [Chitinophaga pinensis DSM 2588]
MNQTNESPSRSFGLDFARALAIIFVLMAHFFKQLDHIGFWGVELFFGLSGFLIGQILWRSYSESNEWSFKHTVNFWSRRWWRTLPNYYLFLIIMLFYHYFIAGGLPGLSVLVEHIWFGQNLLSRQDGFFGVAWSLCIEEFFYLLFPLILFAISRLLTKRKTAFLVALSVIFILSAAVREMLIQQHTSTAIRGVTLARLDAIGCGVLVSFWLSNAEITNRKKWMAFIIGCVLLCIAYLGVYHAGMLYNADIEKRYLLVVSSLGFSLMLPAVSMLPRPQGIFSMFSKWIDSLSFWSYSIYLSHIPILFTIYKLVQHKMLSKLAALVLTLIVSAILFKYFETPMMKKRPKEIAA